MSESTAQSVEAPRAGAARLMSDSRLSRRAAEGDQRAFAAIFRRYHQDLYRYCVAILGDSQDAQDALQNTMVKVLAALPGEQREIQLKPWLYRIAHNEAIDLRRGQRPAEALDAEIPLLEAEPVQAIETQDRVRRLVTDIGMLPERQRGALVMRELSDFSFEQIGDTFGTSAAVARQTVYEARLSLQRMSEGREMDCAAVTKALSDGDGRLLRRREMRAHLRSCAECRRFEDELKDRQRDLAAIAPLPAVAAAGLLQGLIGGAGAGGAGVAGAGGGGALAGAGAATGKTVAGTLLAKSAATVAVVAVVGVSAADRSGLVNVGLPGGGSGNSAEQTPAGSSEASSAATSGQAGSVSSQDAAQQGQLQGGKALQAPGGVEGGQVQSTAGGKGKAEAKGQSEAHQETRHGNGPPAGVPNQGHGNSSSHGNRGAAAGSHSQAGAHSKSGSHSQAGAHGQGASNSQTTGKNPPAQAAPAKQPKPQGSKSGSTGKAHSKGSSRGASPHHSSSAGTRKSHSHQASKPHPSRSEPASSPATEENAQQTAAP